MQGLSAGLIISDRFTLVRRLGGGGMGEVWLADDGELGERIALKLLDSGFAATPDSVDLLRRECSRARALMHPNIVRVYDFHAAEDRYFISMQYIEGDTLVASRGVAFQEIVHRLLMVCDALAYAHRAGVIHRDVKAGNVLLDASGICYLSDFGLASVIASPDGETREMTRGGGTLPAMSPQQLAGAPPTIADDVYSLGALLYELLAGEPLFHPEVTPERIRAEAPVVPAVDRSGQALPSSLTQLVSAMLAKSPSQRPAGIGAVRSVLEDVQADFPRAADTNVSADGAETIRPVVRRATRPGAAATDTTAPPVRRIGADEHRGLSPSLVYGGLAALLVVALIVLFLLPAAVDERRKAATEDAESVAVPTQPEIDPATPDEPNPVALRVQREIADEVLGELLIVEDRLRELGVTVWGGSDWLDVERLTGIGDEAYQDRHFEAAVTNYREALNFAQLIEPRAAELLAVALDEGTQALAAGDAALATERFEFALVIDPVNERAREGVRRASRLDEVLEVVAQASELEEAGDLVAAAAAYDRALVIDPEWVPAREGLARTREGVTQLRFEQRMAAGFGALSRQEFAQARTEFEAALSVRPGDADAIAALGQVDAEAQVAEVVRLQARGRIAEAGEDWATAVSFYEAALKIDPAVTSAQQSLSRAQSRLKLSEDLAGMIARADRLNDERIARDARAVLVAAEAVDSSGTIHSQQTARLKELLRIAAIPVQVEFRSDNLTEVVIYKVGSLGTFQSRTLDLKPGRYVAVGSRAGYRDVRREFKVSPQGTDAPIVMNCEEPI
jgi:tetratricopeptide (TPR) repeat protein